MSSWRITTVSPAYARELLTPEYGERLDPILAQRADRLVGVLNGIDFDAFDPATDPLASTSARGPSFILLTFGFVVAEVGRRTHRSSANQPEEKEALPGIRKGL